MSNGISRRKLLGKGAAALGAAYVGEPGGQVVVTPAVIDDLLANPGMGWETFHRYADEDPALAGLPSSSMYIRFYWREIEPRDGEIDIAKLDAILARAQKAGQRVCFRVMCVGSGEYIDCPAWLKEKGCRGIEFTEQGSDRRHWMPDWDDAKFQQAHFRFIEQLGKRYAADARVDLVDIGTAGLWGEWHMSGCKEVGTGKPAAMPTKQTTFAIIDTWRNAFPNNAKVMLIGDDDGMKYAITHGCGWRADCLGDMGGFSKNWNHMEQLYPQQLKKANAYDAWKSAPVAFETCWDMRKWVQESWDVRHIFDYALELHASYVNNKSAPIPEGTRPEVERLLRRLGYRLVLRRLTHAPSADRGTMLRVAMDWENVGVAPPYADYRLKLRLSPPAPALPVVSLTPVSVAGWLPGRRTIELDFRIPPAIKPGRAELAVGIVDPRTKEPAVRLGIAGRAADGWYPVGSVMVRA